MAFPGEILVGRFNRALNSLFGIKSGSPSPSAGTEVVPTVLLDQNGAVDRRFQEGWNRWAAVVDCPAVAADISQCIFQNPLKSGVIAVIEKLKFATVVAATAGTVHIAFGSSISINQSKTNSVAIPFDQRIVQAVNPFIGGPACSAGFNNLGNTPVSGSFDFDLYPLAAGQFTFDILFTVDQEIVLFPGDFLNVWSSAVNNEFLATFWWRERIREDSEIR